MKQFLNQFLFPFLMFFIFVGIVMSPVADKITIHPLIVFLVIVAAAILFTLFSKSKPDNIARKGVEVEIWAQYIIERLWKDNSFLQRAFSDDDKVLAGKVVHIPQPGARPTVVKNRNTYPASTIIRTDTDVTYTLDEYSTNPTHIPNAQKIEPSYDMIDSVYGDHAGQISEDVAGSAIVTWLTGLPQTNIIRTSGALTSEILPGATGQRKVMVHKDIKKVQKKFNQWNVPNTDRTILLSANMTDELVESLSDSQYRDFSQYVDAKEGIVGRLYSFDIISRSEVAVSTETGGNCAINPYGAAIAAGNHDVAFAWQKNAVARALGEVKFFEKLDDPQFYGDVYSALLRFGGRRRRADDLGVCAVIQST